MLDELSMRTGNGWLAFKLNFEVFEGDLNVYWYLKCKINIVGMKNNSCV